MYRNAIEKLKEWKNSDRRKPLVLRGARQVGKTWLMKEFASSCYESQIYCNFERQADIKTIFEKTKNPIEIVEYLSIIFHQKIDKEKTVIIFDEIQECPEALVCLKYFAEEASEYHIISAGSLLGTMLADNTSYPVGKVNLLDIYPLSFDEFLYAVDSDLYQYYMSINLKSEIPEVFHNRFQRILNDYFIVGGMPEAVLDWCKNHSYDSVRAIHHEILALYENDITKHMNKIDAGRILEVYNSIASQLARESGKFIYGAIKESARAREYSTAIQWLCSAGISERLYNLTKVEFPLNVYKDLDCFKLYFMDVGLLLYLSAIDPSAIILNRNFFFKGALTENFVLTELRHCVTDTVFYYSLQNGVELDFVIQLKGRVIPIEVKAGTVLNSKSFSHVMDKKHLQLGIKLSRMPLDVHESVINLPLYLTGRIGKLLE